MISGYRGYRFKVERSDKLTALIWPPKVLQCLNVRPTATLKEGESVLVSRVQAEIDRDIAKSLGSAQRRGRSSTGRPRFPSWMPWSR